MKASRRRFTACSIPACWWWLHSTAAILTARHRDWWRLTVRTVRHRHASLGCGADRRRRRCKPRCRCARPGAGDWIDAARSTSPQHLAAETFPHRNWTTVVDRLTGSLRRMDEVALAPWCSCRGPSPHEPPARRCPGLLTTLQVARHRGRAMPPPAYGSRPSINRWPFSSRMQRLVENLLLLLARAGQRASSKSATRCGGSGGLSTQECQPYL